MLNSTSRAPRRRETHAIALDVERGDVARVGARMDGDARRAGVDADADRVDDRRQRPAARVAQRRDLVDVDAETHGRSIRGACLTAVGDLVAPSPGSPADPCLRSSRAAAARCRSSGPAGGPAPASARSTRSIASAIAGTDCERGLLAHADVDEHLRIRHELARRGPPARGRCRPSTRSTLSAVAMPSPVKRWSEKMMWPDCSPPIEMPRLHHLLHHVLVADRAAHQLDARLAQRDLEADVAHHGRDERRCRSDAPAPSCAARTSAGPRRRRRPGRRDRRRSRDRRRRRTRRPCGGRPARDQLAELLRDGSSRNRG